MFELLNQEIKEFQAKYNKNCEIIIGKETLKKLLEFYSDEFQLPDLKNSFIVKYQGVNIKQRNFDYGYISRGRSMRVLLQVVELLIIISF